MTYVLYQNKIDKKNIIYITQDIDNILKLLKDGKCNDYAKNSYSSLRIKKYDLEIPFENLKKIRINDDYMTVNLDKKIILDSNDKILYNFNDNEINCDKQNKKIELVKMIKNICYKKNIPNYQNNYYFLACNIENNNNIDEDLDYLESIISELELFSDKT